MRSIFLLLITVFFTLFAACSPSDSPAWQSLLDYKSLQTPPPSVNIFKPQENKELIFVAVEHVSNLAHPVIETIKSVLETKKPQFCILEGFSPEDGISPQGLIDGAKRELFEGKCPENVYAAYLCKENNIPFVGGDIHNEKYLEPLARKGYSEKDVVFWMLAQNFPFWNREGIVNDANFKELATDMIQNNITFWLNKSKLDYTVDEFLEWHEKHMGKPLDVVKDFPWGYDQKEFMPSLAEDATIYKKIQAHIMPLRDTHLINLMRESLDEYDKVLVIFGASHYEWQKSALELLFKKPSQSYPINYDSLKSYKPSDLASNELPASRCSSVLTTCDENCFHDYALARGFRSSEPLEV